VLGASGGVGSTAVGALAAAGYEVWAATGKADQADYLRSIGAHEIVTREVTLNGIEPVLDALLAGEAVGRTVVRLQGASGAP
jgi:NADPH:quinone reductase-like Zn-dependent oxidoreductase